MGKKEFRKWLCSAVFIVKPRKNACFKNIFGGNTTIFSIKPDKTHKF